MSRYPSSLAAALAGPLLAQLVAATLEAQTRGLEVGIGYVANAPDLMLGATLQAITPLWGGTGAFVDVKMDPDSPSREPNFVGGETARDVETSLGHPRFRASDAWFSLGGGLLHSLGGRLVVYGGASWSWRTRYGEYRDPTGERGMAGFYWVEDPDDSGSGAGVMGGIVFDLSRWVRLRFGGESRPPGFAVGAILAVPLEGR